MNRIIRSLLPTVLALLSAVPASAQTSDYWPARLRTDDGADFSERLLAIHNRERAQIGEARLEWDAKLAQDAKAWANRLAATGSFEHAPLDDEGENLWSGTAGAYSVEEMIGHFITERQEFQPGVFPAVARSGNWQRIGHYTQIIWPTTRAVGCAMATRRDIDYLVCRYYPAGNVVGEAVP